jgi:hypothetical protein
MKIILLHLFSYSEKKTSHSPRIEMLDASMIWNVAL